jgi:hypothetical protein
VALRDCPEVVVMRVNSKNAECSGVAQLSPNLAMALAVEGTANSHGADRHRQRGIAHRACRSLRYPRLAWTVGRRLQPLCDVSTHCLAVESTGRAMAETLTPWRLRVFERRHIWL